MPSNNPYAPTQLKKRMLALEKLLKSSAKISLSGYTPRPGADLNRQKKLKTHSKSSFRDLVTEFDKKTEKFLIKAFSKKFPKEYVLGEEHAAEAKVALAQFFESHDEFWVLDPIDGTTNYSRAYPFFCTTAAFLKKNTQGNFEVLVGSVFDPVKNEMFSAAKGCGAFLNGKKIKVLANANPEAALLTTGFASERASSGQASFELFKQLTKETLGVRRDGSAALDLSYVACGRIDAYWEWGLAPWDIAAGTLIVSEAGGQVTNLNNENFDLLKGEVVGSNALLHNWLLKRIKEIRNESA